MTKEDINPIKDGANLARHLCSLGLAGRDKLGIRVRQPLALLTIFVASYYEKHLIQEWRDEILDELNVKDLYISVTDVFPNLPAIALDTFLTQELIWEGYTRDTIRFVNMARKEIGCSITDKIDLYFFGHIEWLHSSSDVLMKETQTKTLVTLPIEVMEKYRERIKLVAKKVGEQDIMFGVGVSSSA